jgi:hypothetical protein
MEGITRSALAIFIQLAAIGKTNESLLGGPHIQWAEDQTKNLIRSEMHLIEIWVRNVCDKQAYDPNDDAEELFFWRKWQAPKLIVMKPSRYLPYDPSGVWERFEAVRSRELLEAFAEHYVLHAEGRVKKVAGQVAVELAKQPAPVLPPVASVQEQPPKSEQKASSTELTQREARRKRTLAKYKRWQKEYLSLKKIHPDRSDVWHSQKIAKMEIAKGSSPETIRKHMKPK